ncbi:MAG: 23S rRNA (guanosine(2251)-2'-O)-methyltransferase RlmB [Deltaproteobacteria bacterium]|nr:23S rRNA (guanosine(2251)-2'-O)-methyltransferase RlmB [Deltaproteobacteria bacterium]
MRIIYGINPIREALKARKAIKKIEVNETRGGRIVLDLIKEAERLGVSVERVGREILDMAAGNGRHQGVVAFVEGGFDYVDIEDIINRWRSSGQRALILILDSIEDPQNLGSLIRAGCAAGANGVVMPKDRAAPVTAAVVKASAGGAEHMLIARVANLNTAIKRLKHEGIWVVGVEADADKNIFTVDLDVDLALVIGGEGKGLRRLVTWNCDFTVSIPMQGSLGSLNAAQAGVIALFEVVRQKGLSNPRGYPTQGVIQPKGDR